MGIFERRLSQAGSGGGDRLRKDRQAVGLVRKTAGAAFGWAWLDPVASWTLRRWFFPVCRAWAAAEIAQSDPDAFCRAIPCNAGTGGRDRIVAALSAFEATRARAVATDAAWHKAFFPANDTGRAQSEADYVALESARHTAAHLHNASRRRFRFVIGVPGMPAVHHDLPDPAEVAATYGPALDDASPFFAPPDPMPTIEISRSVATAEGHDFWLRFPSPSARAGGTVYARVYEPAGVKNPPTIIFGHGICVEFDQWKAFVDEAVDLCRLGFRVIRPEGPFHGRRRPAGYYGGERMIATFPAGALDLFTGAVREWAVLADWARRTSSGALAFGGSSLGALTAQLAAKRSRDWPARLRPDGLLLITHCEQLSRAAIDGDLARMWGGRELWEAKGWTIEAVERYLGLLDAGAELPLPPERVVTVLGKRDRVTPFPGGRDLIEKWSIPDANRFIWDRGHFSIPVMLLRDHTPLRRFRDIMNG